MDKTGLYTTIKDGKRVLIINGKEVDAVFAGNIDHFGLRVDGSNLKADGVDIATSSVAKPNLVDRTPLMFGDASLGNGVCINITAEDYNRLRSGESVAGYARYNERCVYNIVADVATAEAISFTEDGNGNVEFDTGVIVERADNMIYNSVTDTLEDNEEDKTATMTSDACPFVNVKNIDPIVPVGTKLVLEYFVDNKTMDSINRGAIGDTFTVEVKPAWSSQVVKKTTYAGMFSVELPALNTAGETWFSVRCIDSNGVGSVEQHIDLLVRDAVVPNFYHMTDEDLTTYGIVPDNDDVQIAYANKSALANMFANVKQQGYNGITMLKRTYWIDYHDVFGTQTYYKCGAVNNGNADRYGNQPKKVTSLEGQVTEQEVFNANATTWRVTSAPTIGLDFTTKDTGDYFYFVINTSTSSSLPLPDGFTLDLNGATIATTQFTDLLSGRIFELHNYDTHIVNGIIKSSFDDGGFDFATTQRRTGKGVPAEGISVTAIGTGSKYCSLENLDISQTLGYELTVGIDFGTQIHLDLNDNGTENTRINIANGQQEASTGLISSDYITLPDNAETIGFGRRGYGNYDMGTRREVFFSFYSSSKVYISSVKVKMYTVVKVPANAKYLRFTGYGGTKEEWPYSTKRGPLIFFVDAPIVKNILIKDCTWHNTRTCALTISGGIGITIKNCHWYNIALEFGTYQVTKNLGDFEDCSNYNNRITISDCLFEKGSGSNYLAITYCNHFDFINNTGIYIGSGGIEDGFIIGNQMTNYDLYRRTNNPTPHVIYDNNVIGELSIWYQENSVNLDDAVEEVVAMSNTTIIKRCDYKDLRLINSENGGKLVER